MPEYLNHVDPTDLGLLPTLRRLLRLWWQERRLGALGLSLALAYTLVSITIPLLTQRAIDNAIVNHAQPLWPYIVAIVGLAAVRFGINFSRRYATARIGIRIEARMRELLYHAYLRYPRAFFDRHATGQVLSRATNDLYPIRYFIGWGLVQGMQSLMMIVGAGIVLVIVDARLALYTAIAMPPITVLALRFARLVSPISRQVQERKGDVTEAADEAVVGIDRAAAPPGGPPAGPLRRGALRVRRRDRRAARARPRRRAGRDRGRLRLDRQRQDVVAQPAPALLRPDGRSRARRRRRHSRRADRGAAQLRCARHAAARPLLRAVAREPHRRARERGLGRRARRLRSGRSRCIRRRAAGRLRPADR